MLKATSSVFDRAKSIDGVGGLGTSVGLPSLIPDDKDENDFMKIAMITFKDNDVDLDLGDKI